MDKNLVFRRLTLVAFLAAYLTSTIVVITSKDLVAAIGLVLLVGSFVVTALIFKRLEGRGRK